MEGRQAANTVLLDEPNPAWRFSGRTDLVNQRRSSPASTSSDSITDEELVRVIAGLGPNDWTTYWLSTAFNLLDGNPLLPVVQELLHDLVQLCRADGIEPSRLLLDSAADDLTLAVLEQSIALREAGRAGLSLALLDRARAAGVTADGCRTTARGPLWCSVVLTQLWQSGLSSMNRRQTPALGPVLKLRREFAMAPELVRVWRPPT